MSSLPQLTIPQLEYLVAVDEHASWGEAAQALGVSGSALSQGLAELQRRLGLSLFERHGRTQRARPEAAVVTAHARRVLAETRDLADWSHRLQSGEVGRLAVGMIDAAALVWFGETLTAFRGDHPNVDLHVSVAPSAELLNRLSDGQLDLAVAVQSETSPPDLDIEPLVREALIILAPTGQHRRRPENWGPWVTFPEQSHTRQVITRHLRSAGAPVEVVATSSQPEVLWEMVRFGVGWTVLPDPGPLATRSHEGVSPVRRTPLTHRQLCLYTRQGRVPGPLETELISSIRQVASTAPR